MKSSTYKWIIGCLIGIIVILTAFLIVKEVGLITVSFSECLSVAATLSSLILSVVALLYTYYSGRDTIAISDQIKNSMKEIDTKVLQISEAAKSNSETLADMTSTIIAVSEVLNTLNQEHITDQEKQVAIENIQHTKSSMLMFLEKMRQNS